ncbi:S-methyl-5-thioribose-1-phosphate isomerase [Leptolyngbya sp. PCC 6406]|uniref:S-methyl-5-thioribose-1-phosphate isomerase n=1 Tax=Leptolyngbya sp. PCC 6406 TaxID=1173264 RepID=UPI0002ABEFB4|nr:S-methyl-5-thioribose-1-phosphate isomerase [Leptolyngbya sp. PCC 6406]
MTDTLQTHVYPVLWQQDHVLLIDQTKLPRDYTVVSISRCEDMITAINSRIVRGGPALGIAAAYGLYLGARDIASDDRNAFLERLEAIAEQLKGCRPDKANLLWCLDHMVKVAQGTSGSVAEVQRTLLHTAQTIQRQNWDICQAIGRHGLAALPETPAQLTLYTHCNHGALATSGYGTSLGVVRAAWQAGRLERVIAGETRPWLQGSRLTAWECVQENIPVTVVTDSTAAHCMQQGWVHGVLVGADRIAANGDTVNKIGTYPLALAAQAQGVPFFVAAPLSTVDFTLPTGQGIEIPQGDATDVCGLGQTQVCPSGVTAYHPLADVTPAGLITAIITEEGAISPQDLAAHAHPKP